MLGRGDVPCLLFLPTEVRQMVSWLLSCNLIVRGLSWICGWGAVDGLESTSLLHLERIRIGGQSKWISVEQDSRAIYGAIRPNTMRPFVAYKPVELNAKHPTPTRFPFQYCHINNNTISAEMAFCVFPPTDP